MNAGICILPIIIGTFENDVTETGEKDKDKGRTCGKVVDKMPPPDLAPKTKYVQDVWHNSLLDSCITKKVQNTLPLGPINFPERTL